MRETFNKLGKGNNNRKTLKNLKNSNRKKQKKRRNVNTHTQKRQTPNTLWFVPCVAVNNNLFLLGSGIVSTRYNDADQIGNFNFFFNIHFSVPSLS